jgi:hypothetical protein
MTPHLNPFEQFLSLFQKLKAAAGTPQRLASFYQESSALRDTTAEFEDYVGRSGQFERRVFLSGPKRFSQVPAGFEKAWEEYKGQWAYAIANAELSELVGTRVPFNPDLMKPTDTTDRAEPDLTQHTEFDPMHHDGGAALQLGIDYLSSELDAYSDQVRSGKYSGYAEFTANKCRIALDAFDYLKIVIGIDLDDVFRRWCEVPTVFMPSVISDKHGREKGSLNDLLDNAVRAYVCGAPAAAIAMCRAILEIVLTVHYLPDDLYETDRNGGKHKKKLGKLIVAAEKRYEFLRPLKCGNLKEKGDEILHRYRGDESLSMADEIAIVGYMRTLKALIQRAAQLRESEVSP